MRNDPVMTTEDLEGISHRLKMDYLHRNGLRELRRFICACQLNGFRKCQSGGYGSRCTSPREDHPACFKVIATGELVLVSQPYYGRDVRGADVGALTAACEAFARKFGLTVRVSADESWHYPNRTVLVEYRKAARA